MNLKDMKQAVVLLDNEWNLGKKEANTTSNICAWIYLMEILEESEKIEIYKENGKLIGFCGYSKNASKKYLFKKKLYGLIKRNLCNSKKIKNPDAFNQYYINYNYLPKEYENYFDGEVSILIVDSNFRGKNIGKKLLLKIFELAKNDDMKNLQILTDESCNYKFYEKCGCNKIYETIVQNKEYDKVGNFTSEKAFVYEKKL